MHNGDVSGKERVVIGLVSGSSVDGIDAGLVTIKGTCERSALTLKHFVSVPFDATSRRQILDLFHYETATIDKIVVVHAIMGELFAEAALQVAAESGTPMSEVDVIGVWGQMMYHRPAHVAPFEWRGQQLGGNLQCCDLSRIALRTGVTTVGDVAAGDLADGGNGAPFTALLDYAMYHHPRQNRVVQNFGGIGNCNLLPAAGDVMSVVGFDTGPGNMVIDELVRQYTGGAEHFDRDGERAARGTVNRALLQELMLDAFIQAAPPKAAGREQYGAHFARHILQRAEELKLAADDVVATATVLTAEAVALNYRRHLMPICPIDEVIVGGGGALNQTLLKMLRERLDCTISTHDAHGNPSFAIEAMDMALIANETSLGHTNHVPRHTGGTHRTFMGLIAPGKTEQRNPYRFAQSAEMETGVRV
jgi:anhydro-N-acetylmuramic acid kinase